MDIGLLTVLLTIIFGVPGYLALRAISRRRMLFIEEDLINLTDRVLSQFKGIVITYNEQRIQSNLFLFRGTIIATGRTDIEAKSGQHITYALADGQWKEFSILGSTEHLGQSMEIRGAELRLTLPLIKQFDFVRFEALAECNNPEVKLNHRIPHVPRIKRMSLANIFPRDYMLITAQACFALFLLTLLDTDEVLLRPNRLDFTVERYMAQDGTDLSETQAVRLAYPSSQGVSIPGPPPHSSKTDSLLHYLANPIPSLNFRSSPYLSQFERKAAVIDSLSEAMSIWESIQGQETYKAALANGIWVELRISGQRRRAIALVCVCCLVAVILAFVLLMSSRLLLRHRIAQRTGIYVPGLFQTKRKPGLAST